MSSNPDFVQYIADQCSSAGEITTKKMFGDYGIYCNGIIFGLICDNCFYVKPTEAGRRVLRELMPRPPYKGVKDYFFIEDVDDRDYLILLVRETIKELHNPKKGKKKILIRPIKKEEYLLLEDFLYEAIFIPDGVMPPPKEIIYQPELQVYISDFGNREGDMGIVAEVEGKVVGACWVRIMNDYGHVDDSTPSFAISLLKEYRNKGIGTALMKDMLKRLTDHGYQRASLAVQKTNYAVKMYQSVGFEIIEEKDEEYIMLWRIMK